MRRPRRRSVRSGRDPAAAAAAVHGFARSLAFGVAVALVALFVPAPAAAGGRVNPAQTVGPEACGKCHDLEFARWQDTAHAKLYRSEDELEKRPRAQEIKKNLGIRLIRTDSLCLDCHFTPRVAGGRVTAMAGVSCESCHGAAQGWITVHNSVDGRQVDRATESADQRRRRRQRNLEAGMYSPADLYGLVSRCYACHLVPDERLVEVGGHTKGGGFDLVERLDQVRHYFVTGNRRENAPIPPEHRRQLVVLGPALELEWGLRALAAAEDGSGGYARSAEKRVTGALRALGRLDRAFDLPEVDAALAAAEGLRLTAGNAAELAAAADRVARAARAFAANHDGSRLAALDRFAGGDEPPAEEGGGGAAGPGEAGEGEIADLGAVDSGSAAAGAAGAGGVPAGGGGSGSAAPAARVPLPTPEGEIQARLRPPLSARTVVGQGKCDACHNRENDWWYRDAHQKTADPFFHRARRNVELATLYYGKPAAGLMATGRAVCMDCHGTVVAAGREADSGVSCESCHGPAGDFLKPHPTLDRARRLDLGMVDLADLDARARVCASCHVVTDRRLLASGHPPGKAFDPVERMRRIEHWKGGQPAAAALTAAWSRAVAARGPVPQVRVVAIPEGWGTAGGGGAARDVTGPSGAPRGSRAAAATYYPPPPVRPGGPAGSARTALPGARLPAARPLAAGALDLPPPPADLADRPLDELLAAVQERLDRLFAATGGGG